MCYLNAPMSRGETLHTVVVLSNAACRCIEELRENLDAVFDSATQIAAQSNIDTEVK